MLKSTWKVNQPLGKLLLAIHKFPDLHNGNTVHRKVFVTLMKAHTIAEIQQTLQQVAWCTGIKTTKKSYQFKAFIKTNFNVGLQKFCCMCTPTPSPQAI